MARSFRSTFGLSLLAAALVAATGLASLTTYQIQPDASSMQISGTSTLHDWTCDVGGLDGTLMADAAASEAPDEAVPLSAVTGVQVSVPVDRIDCDKDRMNRNLREAMKANAYPEILFSLSDATLAPLPDSSASWFRVDASGELIISGTRKQVALDVRGQRLDDGRLRFVGETPLLMSDFDVERPSFMLGTVKTGDEVTVRFDVVAATASN